MRDVNAILTIAYRDLMKFVRDRPRLIGTFIFPLLLIGVLGGSLQANIGSDVGYDFLAFVFTGMLAQTLFQSTAQGIISLISDREQDFSQEMFIAPISRYAIVGGKIVGETLVSLTQGLGIVLFGLILGLRPSPEQLPGLLLVSVACCLLGGAFGLLLLANLSNQRTANQIFPFILLPQFFLAGVFNPITILPPGLDILSKIAPLRYAVDLTRGVWYAGRVDAPKVVLQPPLFNLVIMAGLFAAFLIAGTFLFVRNERNR